MVSGNYPPGTTRRDLVRGGIIQPHSHECEFVLDDRALTFEDGAVFLKYKCDYVEGLWNEGYECGREKAVRWDRQWVSWFEDDDIVRREVPAIDEEFEDEELLEKVEKVEFAQMDDEGTVDEMDPDRTDGIITYVYDGTTIGYSP